MRHLRLPQHLLAAAGLAVSSLSALADNTALAGAEVGAQGSRHVYAGTVMKPAGDSPWRARLWLDETRYEYDTNGTTVKARARGAEAAVGLGGASGADWWAAYFGPRHERTTLSPDDRGNDSRGSRTRAKLQAETERGVGAWRLNAGAAWVFGADKYWLRGRLMHPLAPRSLLGVELLRHGGPDYTATQMGGLYTLPLGERSSALLKGGLRHDESGGTGGYAGVELSIPY